MSRNDGFARPINQALRASQGRYMLVLNPDTIILPGALNELVQYHRIPSRGWYLWPEGLESRWQLTKSLPARCFSPMGCIQLFLWVCHQLFPHSKFFGGYLLNYLDENEVHEVDGISGSCMLIRRQVIDQIGYLDERFFAYQEDADYCFQAKKAGWKIVYLPAAQIIHFGGQGGSRVQPYRSIYEWHRSYYLYYRKNLARDYFFLFNWLYYFLMGRQAGCIPDCERIKNR